MENSFPFSDRESACSVVMDTMFGDEFDDSDSETETETETCQLWNLNFGWLHESTPQVDFQFVVWHVCNRDHRPFRDH